MAERKVWVGSSGPFLYDDTDLIDDEDGDLAGLSIASISTTGQMQVMTAPSINGHVLRMEDVTDAAHLTYEEGVLNLTAAGYATPPAVTGNYVKLGKMVTLTLATFVGVSNSTTFSAATLPASIRPIANVNIPIVGQDNGVTKLIVCVVGVGGSLFFQSTPGSNSSWTASGNKGISSMSVSYLKL